MVYGAGTCAVKKAHDKKLDVVEMRLLRWISGFTNLDRIRNEIYRWTMKVGEISKNVQKKKKKTKKKKKKKKLCLSMAYNNIL